MQNVLKKISNFFKPVGIYLKNYDWKDFLIFIITIAIITLIISFTIFKIYISNEKITKVPNLKDKLILESLDILQQKNLYPEVQIKYSYQPYGTIIDQRPEAGQVIKENRHIILYISRGPREQLLEDFSGKTLFYIEKRLMELNSKLNKKIVLDKPNYQYSDIYPRGEIILQDPVANTNLFLVNNLKVTISKGENSKKVKVNSYIGTSKELAIKAIKSIGLIPVIQEIYAEEYDQIGQVIKQDIEPNSIVSKGSKVTIFIGISD